MTDMADHNITFYGFTAVPRDPEILFKDHPTASGANPKQDPFTVDDIPLPDSQIVREVKAFAKVRFTLPLYGPAVINDPDRFLCTERAG